MSAYVGNRFVIAHLVVNSHRTRHVTAFLNTQEQGHIIVVYREEDSVCTKGVIIGLLT